MVYIEIQRTYLRCLLVSYFSSKEERKQATTTNRCKKFYTNGIIQPREGDFEESDIKKVLVDLGASLNLCPERMARRINYAISLPDPTRTSSPLIVSDCKRRNEKYGTVSRVKPTMTGLPRHY